MEKAKPASLPANYVSIVELKERWLENQRQQKEKERQQKEEEQRRQEELRQQRLREEQEASKPKPIPKTETDSKPPRGRSYRAKYPPPNPSVPGIQWAELEEKKAEEPAEVEKKVKKKKVWGQNKKKHKAAMEKEGKADAPPQASGEEGGNPAREIEIRAKIENAGQAVQKFGSSSANDDKLKGPSRDNQKFRGLSGEAGKGDDKLRRPRRVDVGIRDLAVNGEDDNLRRQSEFSEKFGDLSVNVEAGEGGDKLRRPSRVYQKCRNLPANGEAERRDDGNSRRPTKFDRRGNGGYGKADRLDGRGNGGSGKVWVKKGEVAGGNGGGVESSEQGGVVSGQTETSSNAGSLTLAGKMAKSCPTRQ